MNSQLRRLILVMVAGIGSALILVLAWQNWPGGQATVPKVNTDAMEPQVATLIDETISQLRGRNENADAWGRLAQVYHAHDLYAPALYAYDQAIEKDSTSFRWHYLAAHAQTHIAPSEAVERFRQALKLAPERDEARLGLADTLIELGGFDEAANVLQQISLSGNYGEQALLGLGRISLLRNEQARARESLEAARELAPRNGEIHSLLAQIYLRAGDAELAAEAETRAKTFPKGSRPQDLFLSTMESLAVNSRAYTKRGIALAENGNYAKAEMEFREVLAIRAGTAIDHSNLASALLRQGKASEAFKEFGKAMSLDAENSEVLNNYGLALLQSGATKQAVKLLSRAVELDPGYAQAHLNLGVFYESQGKLPDAEASYLRALEVDGSLADGWLNLGSLRARREDFAAAIDAWERLRLLRPSDPAAVYNLGLAHRKLGQHQQAVSLFSEGLSIAPNSSRFVAELAWEQATAPDENARDGTAALTLAERLVAARPKEPRFADIKAAALAELGEFEAAHALAEQAAALAPSGGELALEIAERVALYEAGKPYRQPAPAAVAD